MTTIVERQDGGSSTALVAVVSIILLVLVAGAALYSLRMYPFDAQAGDGITIQLNERIPNPVNPGTSAE